MSELLPPTPPLAGIPIQVASHMAGAKKAVELNGTLYVSPAMYALMKNASHEELKHLLSNLPLVRLGTFDPFDLPLVMMMPDRRTDGGARADNAKHHGLFPPP